MPRENPAGSVRSLRGIGKVPRSSWAVLTPAPHRPPAPGPVWQRSGSSVRCQFVQCKGVHTGTKRPVLVGVRTARRGVPSPPPSCQPGSRVACAPTEVAKGSDLMSNDTASKDGPGPIQFSMSNTVLGEPSAGLGEWAVKWKLPPGQFLRP